MNEYGLAATSVTTGGAGAAMWIAQYNEVMTALSLTVGFVAGVLAIYRHVKETK